MKKTLSKLIATALVVVGFISTSSAQKDERNIGASCGCPAIGSRTAVKFSTLPVTTANGIIEFTGTVHLDCSHLYDIDSISGFGAKYYVPYGDSIIIDPGTVIRGQFSADPAASACLIIERGGKIIAQGTKDCEIVMTTDQDPMDGTYSITNVSKWGGLILCGMATNSVVSPTNDAGLGIPGRSGEGHCEGFVASNAGNIFGASTSDADSRYNHFIDNDNSGILQYVSVRHPGALVGGSLAGNEINGISLYSVGSGTTIDHCEVISSGDDGIEFFGGTVNVKNTAVMFGDDDNWDFDLGYSGKGQFYFAIQADTLNSGSPFHSGDNGFECDADDQFAATFATSSFEQGALNHSYPNFYNITMIGNGHVVAVGDNTGGAAIQAKECTAGHWYNCVFANWRSGLHLAEARSTSLHKGDAYDQWTNNASDSWLTANGGVAQYMSLTVKNCTFIVPQDGAHYGFTRGTLVAKNSSDGYIKLPPTTIAPGIPTAADSAQFFGDGNTIVAAVPGIDYRWSLNAGNTSFTNPFHVTPASNLATNTIPPNDGFFTQVNYRGAFDANATGNWLSDWALVTVKSLADANPTDINKDGVTNIDDFLILVGKFGQQDQ